MKKNIAILGGGNLGQAIARGLDQSGFLDGATLTITRRHTASIKHLENERIRVSSDNRAALADAAIVVIGVQPNQLDNLLAEVGQDLDPARHTIVSVLTAVTIGVIEQKLGPGFAVVRAMPNTAISVMQSMTCMAYNPAAEAQIDHITALFGCLGHAMVIEERLMQAATVVCASGIAFWMRFIRATTQGGVQLGFDAQDAQAIAVQSCLGAASLLAKNGNHPEREIDKVTTPQGCTIAGLNEMEHHGLSSALIKGLVTSYNRIGDMR